MSGKRSTLVERLNEGELCCIGEGKKDCVTRGVAQQRTRREEGRIGVEVKVELRQESHWRPTTSKLMPTGCEDDDDDDDDANLDKICPLAA